MECIKQAGIAEEKAASCRKGTPPRLNPPANEALVTKGYSGSMHQTLRSGLRIRYERVGSGPPVVLIHGYTASGYSNWIASGWAKTLASSHTLLIPDLRGHGRSQKPFSPAAYSIPAMAGDVLAVMDREGVDSAPIFGYSMGGMVTLELLLEHPLRVESAIIGGMGSYFPRGRGRFAIERQDSDSEAPRRSIFDQARFLAAYVSRLNPIAMEATYRGVFKNGRPVDPERLAEVSQPVLVVAGDQDPFFAPAKALAEALPHAQFLDLPNEGHLSAVRNPEFMAEVRNFLAEVPTAPVSNVS